MTKVEIALQRLHQQQLSHPQFERAEEVVGWLGAVQSQDYAAAKWAVAERSMGLTDAVLEQAFASGAILRTHIMRPTWHFVTPADIRWMQMLTAPRVKAFNAYYYRRLALDDAICARSNAILAKALQGGKQLTRVELGIILHQAGIDTHDLLRLTYIMLQAELDAVVCSGARRGKQFTYALLDERAPLTLARNLDHEEALAELTRRYFTGHGPATVNDFVWWSGLTATDVKAGLVLAAPYLANEVIEGQTYWFSADMPPAANSSPAVYLLPNFDEYIVGYNDRTAAFDAQDTKMENPRDNIVFNYIIVIDGRVSGTWKRSFNRGQISFTSSTFANLSAEEENALAATLKRYGDFHGMPIVPV
jgi:hypothetical protein